MEQTVLICNILGCDVRSRSNVENMKTIMTKTIAYTFDMKNVKFISRSVADEFCNLAEEYSIKFINNSEFIENMLQAVLTTRNKHRVREIKESQIIECEDMESLRLILETI